MSFKKQQNNYLLQSVTDLYGVFYTKRYLSLDTYHLIKKSEANRLLIKFLPETDFFDHSCFSDFSIENNDYQKFRGAFYCSTLPLVIKLSLLEDILKSTDWEGISAFPPWTRLFRSSYNRKLITRRNIEMSGYLHLSEYLKTNSQHHV